MVRSTPEMDVIISPFAIIMANSMMGELTPKMAESITSSKAKKILIPLTQEVVTVIGVSSEPLPHLVDQAVDVIKEMCMTKSQT